MTRVQLLDFAERPPVGKAANLGVPCDCGGGRLVVLADRHGRPVALVVHAPGCCPLGQLIAGQPTVVVDSGQGRWVATGSSASAAVPQHLCPTSYVSGTSHETDVA
jgi:hypothetical protein